MEVIKSGNKSYLHYSLKARDQIWLKNHKCFFFTFNIPHKYKVSPKNLKIFIYQLLTHPFIADPVAY